MKYDVIYNQFRTLAGIDESSFTSFLEITSDEFVKEGEHYVTPQSSQTKMGILVSGCMKSYYINHSGAEYIKSFLVQNDICAAHKSDEFKFEREVFIKACRDSHVLTFDYNDLLMMAQKNSKIKDLMFKSLELEFIKNEQKEYNFITKDIEDNFRLINEFLRDNKVSVKQKDIANYLGITSIAYSRIKKRLS